MRHEYRLNTQRAQKIEDVFQAEAAGLQRRYGVLNTARLGALAVLDEVLAPPPDSMDLFSEVDCLEPREKRADQISRQGWRPASDSCSQLDCRLLIPVSPLDRGYAIMLSEIKELLATLLLEDVADESAQRMYVIAQRFVP